MIEHTRCINIDGEEWRRELEAIGWEIMDAEPMAALRRLDAMLERLTRDDPAARRKLH